jgi:hypothetical protein
MTDTALATTNSDGPDTGAIERVVALGDLSKLSPEQRARYYFEVCASLKLNPLTRPFEYLSLNQKLVLYARKDATDQLRNLHRISLEIVSRETTNDLYVVTAKARSPDGRTDEEIGAVSIAGLEGDALANAFMKASTKAKRRVTLSICGLGLLDETELETVRDAFPVEEERVIGRRRVSYSEEPIPTTLEPEQREEPALLPASMDPARVDHPRKRPVDAEAEETSPLWPRCVEMFGKLERAGVGYERPSRHAPTDVLSAWLNESARALRAKTGVAR